MPIIYIYIYTAYIYNDTSCIIWVWVNTYRYILVGWTSIYQLFWGSLGTRVLTHPHMYMIYVYITYSVCYIPVGRPRVFSIDRKGASGATAHGGVVTTNGDGARDGTTRRARWHGKNARVISWMKRWIFFWRIDWLAMQQEPIDCLNWRYLPYIYIYPYISIYKACERLWIPPNDGGFWVVRKFILVNGALKIAFSCLN